MTTPLQRIGFAILTSLSVVLPAVSAQEATPLALQASAAEAPKAQTPAPKKTTPQAGGAFGVKQVDPFRKNETPQNVEKRPNIFQELLDRQIELPTRRRPAAQPRRTTNSTNNTNPFEEASNPFEDAEDFGNPFGETRNPFEDAGEMDNPFGARNPFEDDGDVFGGTISINSSNPFAAGDPFGDEDPRNQGGLQSPERSPASPLRTSANQDRPHPSPSVMPNFVPPGGQVNIPGGVLEQFGTEVLNIPDGPSIPAPEKGYVWDHGSPMEIEGIKGDFYACFSMFNPQGATIALMIEHDEAQNDDARVAALKRHYSGLYSSINNPNFTIGNVTRPDMTFPIPQAVSYAIQAKKSDGSDFYAMSTTVFSKKNFIIRVMSPSKAESQKVLNFVVRSILEDESVSISNRTANQNPPSTTQNFAPPAEEVNLPAQAPETSWIDVLEIPNGPSIPAPDEGRVWKKVQAWKSAGSKWSDMTVTLCQEMVQSA